jgi:lysozyme
MQDPPVDKPKAEEYLNYEMTKAQLSAIKYCPVLLFSDPRLAAITDFVYNLGAGGLQNSTLRRRINQGNWELAKKELMRWVRGGGKILPGLVKRRKVEASLL